MSSEKMNKIGGLAQFLSQATVEDAQKAAQALDVVQIDIDKLIPDPYNAYGLRDVDSLAGMIASNNFHVEAIEVRPMEDGNYMIISGHRRRAAWEMLLKEGATEKRELPCIVRRFEDMHIQVDNDNGVAEEAVITAEQQANIALILANRGQRKEKTIQEELWEIQQLEPYVRLMYKQMGRPHERGQFKSFFASVLNITPNVLQKMKNLLRLIPRAQMALADKEINKSVAVEISGLEKDEQDRVLDLIFSGELENSYMAMLDFKKRLKSDGETADEITDEDEDEEEDFSDGAEDGHTGFAGFSPLDDLSGDDEPQDEGFGAEPAPPRIEDEARGMGYGEPLPPVPAQEGSYEDKAEALGQTRLIEDKKDDIPEPPDTGNPQADAHKWFITIIQPEIDRLEKIMEECIAKKKFYEASNEKGAAFQAARWDTCRSYLALKIIALKDKD